MRHVIEIETKRLRLRSLWEADAPAVARYAGNPAVARMVARVPLPYFVCAAEAWIMVLNARAPLAEDRVFAIDAAGEGLIGVIGAHRKGAGAFEVGYWVGQPFWGRGYASEALGVFVSEARAFGPLEAGHFVDNPASGRVLEKNGFVYTGESAAMFSLGRGARVECRRMAYREAGQARAAKREAAFT